MSKRTVAERLEQIAENEQKVYIAGYGRGYDKGQLKGFDDGYSSGHENGYAEGYEACKMDEKDEAIPVNYSFTLSEYCAGAMGYPSGSTFESWSAHDGKSYKIYGFALNGAKTLRLSGAALHSSFSQGEVKGNILFVCNFTDDGGGVAVVSSNDIDVTPETYDVYNMPVEYIITVPSGLGVDGVYFSCSSASEPVLEIIERADHLEWYNNGYIKGNADGMINMNTVMMNAIIGDGTKTDYPYYFYGEAWNDEIFKPQTVMKITAFNRGLSKSKVEYGAYTDLLDFSNCLNMSYAFTDSTIRKLRVVDASKVSSNYGGLNYTFDNCRNLESIDEFYPPNSSYSANFTNTFRNCTSLTRIIFKSEIVRTGLNLSTSPLLDTDSIVSIINNLSDATSGLAVTLSKTAVDNACAQMHASSNINSTNSSWWAWLIGTKPNWTISLV